jgi:predicted DNA binding protein
MITEFNKYKLNETYELSGKHSFFTFLQIISNHDFHFILNDHFTKLYKYHFFFSTETIQKVEDFVEIFKYKHSLASTYEILLKIRTNKLAFFFGIKEKTLLRYGFVDLDSQRSYVVGEFNVTGEYFRTISKYKALQTINKIIQNVDVKNLVILSKIKDDLKKFYKEKEGKKIKIIDNKVIKYYDKNQFTEEDLRLNRPYRILDKWISKRSWRNNVEYNVDDTTDPIQFIIIVK